MGRVDILDLRDFVARELKPFYDTQDTAAWNSVRARSKWIGHTDRPSDIAYRRMRPAGYMQLCVANDEQPYSPWALLLPDDLRSSSALCRLLDPIYGMLNQLYGDGTLCFSGFAILAPQGIVPPHVDMPHDVNKKRFSHHLHIPLTQADTTEFTVGGETFVMEQGGAYEINNMVVHSVVNRGEENRVNLMLDYCPAQNLVKRNSASPSPRDTFISGNGQIHVA
jgi:hypothetical protein